MKNLRNLIFKLNIPSAETVDKSSLYLLPIVIFITLQIIGCGKKMRVSKSITENFPGSESEHSGKGIAYETSSLTEACVQFPNTRNKKALIFSKTPSPDNRRDNRTKALVMRKCGFLGPRPLPALLCDFTTLTLSMLLKPPGITQLCWWSIIF